MTKRHATLLGGAVVVLLVLFALSKRGEDGLQVELGQAENRERFRSFVTASGEILAERYADVGSSVMGRVVDLPVTEGQEVGSGDLLARIDPVQAQSAVEAAQASIAALQADAQSAAGQLRQASAELENREAQAREATVNFERLEALYEQELVAASQLDSARATAESRTAQVNSAVAAVARAKSAGRAAARRVSQARAQADRALDTLGKTAIESPIDGVVSRLQVRQGEMVVIGIQNQPGTVLMTVSDLNELNAEVQVAEADVLRVKVGQEATISLEALPGRSFAGRVTEVGASALPQQGAGAAAREFRVEIRLLEPVEGMRPGLTCDAEVLVGEKTNITVVPLQSVVIRMQEGVEQSGVFAVEEGRARFVPVETGIIGGLDIEVEGISQETAVVTGPYQVLRELEDGMQVTSD